MGQILEPKVDVSDEVLHELSDDTRLVVSEPLGDLRGAWREVPESTCLIVRDGREELEEFCRRSGVSAGYVSTSALSGAGLADLVNRMKAVSRLTSSSFNNVNLNPP